LPTLSTRGKTLWG